MQFALAQRRALVPGAGTPPASAPVGGPGFGGVGGPLLASPMPVPGLVGGFGGVFSPGRGGIGGFGGFVLVLVVLVLLILSEQFMVDHLEDLLLVMTVDHGLDHFEQIQTTLIQDV